MTIVGKRFEHIDASLHFMDQLLDMDECLEVLDEYDARKVHQEQKTCAESLQDMKAFEKDFIAKRRQLELDRLAALPKAKAKPKAKAAPAVAKAIVPNKITQNHANKYMPPGASLWRGRQKRTWNAHVQGRSRISEPWADDEHLALLQILGRSWQLWIDMRGKSWNDCPWDLAQAVEAARADVKG